MFLNKYALASMILGLVVAGNGFADDDFSTVSAHFRGEKARVVYQSLDVETKITDANVGENTLVRVIDVQDDEGQQITNITCIATISPAVSSDENTTRRYCSKADPKASTRCKFGCSASTTGGLLVPQGNPNR